MNNTLNAYRIILAFQSTQSATMTDNKGTQSYHCSKKILSTFTQQSLLITHLSLIPFSLMLLCWYVSETIIIVKTEIENTDLDDDSPTVAAVPIQLSIEAAGSSMHVIQSRKNFQFVHYVENIGKSSDKKLQNKIFLQKFKREKEIVDLSLLPTLPSCEANAEYIMCDEYAAFIFRNGTVLPLHLETHFVKPGCSVPYKWKKNKIG